MAWGCECRSRPAQRDSGVDLEQFETEHDGIGFIYDPGVSHTTQTDEEYIGAVETYGQELLVVEEGEQLPVAGVDVFALNPPAGDSGENLEHNCLALQVEYDGVTHLMTGDTGSDTEQRMILEPAAERYLPGRSPRLQHLLVGAVRGGGTRISRLSRAATTASSATHTTRCWSSSASSTSRPTGPASTKGPQSPSTER